jgi:transcriptional regulator with XRE-family HTH domain
MERINLKQRLGVDNPESEARMAEYRKQCDVAQKLYDIRTERGLTQAEVAALVGTSASVISRMEDADYNLRQSLRMLDRIATALGYELSVTFTPVGASAA